jgi:hypothetical protein
MSSTHIVLSSAAAAVVLGSHYIVDAFPLTRAAVRPSSVDRAIDRTLAARGERRTCAPPLRHIFRVAPSEANPHLDYAGHQAVCDI